MPWHDNSGNNGNSNANNEPTRGPWGQPPRGNGSGNGRGSGRGSEPPDLEELLEASRQRLKRAFPRRGGGGGRGGGDLKVTPPMFAAAGGIIALLYVFTGIFQVEPSEQAVMTTFGKYSGLAGPGLHWHAPGIQAYKSVPVQQEQTNNVPPPGQSENLMLTSDRNIVDISFEVTWRIKELEEQGELPNAAKYLFNIEDPSRTVQAVAEAAMRETIGGKELDPIITSGQAEVREQTRERIQQTLDDYRSGIEVVRVTMKRPEAPASVREAFVDVVKARNDKDKMINEAERDANQIVPVAEGEAQRILQEAQAYAATTEADAIGQAERFNKIYEEYRKAPEVTRQRMYLETVEKVLGGMNKIVIDEQAGSGIVPYLPLNELTRRPQINQ